MDYVIEIQGLRDKDNKFLSKEVAIASLQENVSGHWIINPPHTFAELPRQARVSNDYLSSKILGIHWFDGDISLRKLQHQFYNIARNADKIYVRGSDTSRFVQSMMTRSIVDIED